MLALALLLVAGGAALLVAGAVTGAMEFVHGALVASFLAAVLLPIGVIRNRPRRRPDASAAPTWSGAADEAGEGSPPGRA